MNRDINQLINLNITTAETNPLDKWNFKEVNWNRFQELCSQLPDIDFSQNIDNILSLFTSQLINMASQSIPKCNSYNIKRVPWWSDDCPCAIWNRRRTLKTLKKQPNHFKVLNYRRRKEVAQRTIKLIKKKWRKYISDINSFLLPFEELNLKKVNSSLKEFIDNEIHTNHKTIANVFA